MMRSRKRTKNEGGFVFVLIALSSLTLVLMVGFAVDLGSWYLSAAKLQRASDSAALAGATVLPDVAAAQAKVDDAYLRNGYVHGAKGITIETEATNQGINTSVRNAEVPTYFTKSILQKLSISRKSRAVKSTSAPELGSPFNVLGTGDLTMPGLSEKQNFWLAMNGTCSPKEDGDYFLAQRDGNKGPFTTNLDADNNYLAPNGSHRCNGGVANTDYEPGGYSYFIDVPKPAVAGGSVDVYIYDPAYNGKNAGETGNMAPDVNITLGKDDYYYDNSPAYNLWDTNGTPNITSDDTQLLSHPHSVSVHDFRYRMREWWKLGTIPASRISEGGQFRVQSFNRPIRVDSTERGINSFSIGAFPSWLPSMTVCDVRDNPSCPRVYGRNAMSVNTKLSGAPGQKVEMYYAKVDKGFAGSSFDVMLWDPGEGVQRIEMLLPDGSPMSFDWTTSPDGGAGYSGTGVNFIKTDDFGPPAYGRSLSNPYKFNDRLITMRVTLPTDYAGVVDSADSDWLKMRYTIGTKAADRTTWGIGLSGGKSGAAQLTRPTL